LPTQIIYINNIDDVAQYHYYFTLAIIIASTI